MRRGIRAPSLAMAGVGVVVVEEGSRARRGCAGGAGRLSHWEVYCGERLGMFGCFSWDVVVLAWTGRRRIGGARPAAMFMRLSHTCECTSLG